MGKSTSLGKVEVVLTKPNGERIEVEVGENDMVYIDVEAGEQCTMNKAQRWAELTDERRQQASQFIKSIQQDLEGLLAC
ncbi:hypothetical protein LN040_02875 [Desulfovibrio subterraneus]|jgi:oxalate decarboxylase/phosphoglucose isomerase-like protein (cupin superfamily)|uniref:Uncharacterized protein n=1 Tax=Desulfovibrio subterraneus TaxID=2718620 RepID=A0A7J0BJQ6_9BACT|nr:hypothetical protein [Desulfovibrio subterraneus]WBF68067.1 hypothetical protein LN040_02875 [Desulfovibrio subterraneus]GFM33946.1 hypothetical protein DSM101010T_23110 [Desulfovibrio subterraneus]